MPDKKDTKAKPPVPIKAKKMTVWDSLATTDEKFTKPFNRGSYKGTTINKQYCLLKMTEVFGACGVGWGVREDKLSFKTMPNNDVMAMSRVVVWYIHPDDGRETETPPGYGADFFFRSSKDKTDDDAIKKAFSDALTNALKYIGMSADVYLGFYDDDKYLEDLRQREDEPSSLREPSTASEPSESREPSSESEPDNPTEPTDPSDPNDRQSALDMMKWETDPGTDVFRVSPDGTVVFLNHNNEVSWENISYYMIALIRSMPGVNEIISFAAENHAANEAIQIECDLNPFSVGARGWAKAKLESIENLDLPMIKKAWNRISRKVNPLKNTEPSIFEGITDAFKQSKNDLTTSEDSNG